MGPLNVCYIFFKGTSLEAPCRGLALLYYICIICLYFIVLEDEREEGGTGLIKIASPLDRNW